MNEIKYTPELPKNIFPLEFNKLKIVRKNKIIKKKLFIPNL